MLGYLVQGGFRLRLLFSQLCFEFYQLSMLLFVCDREGLLLSTSFLLVRTESSLVKWHLLRSCLIIIGVYFFNYGLLYFVYIIFIRKSSMRHYESYLEFLSEERVEEATTMLCSSFLKFNSIWKKLGVPYEEAYTVNKARMIEGLTINCSTLGIDAQTNKVIFVCTTVDLAHYMDEELMPRTYRWSNFINQWSYKLEHKEW